MLKTMSQLRPLCASVLVFGLWLSLSTVIRADDDEKSVLCFHDIDGVGGRDTSRFSLDIFDPQFCTHLVYSTIRLDIVANEILKFSDFLKEKNQNDKLIASLKTKNPHLKILVILNLDQFFWHEMHMEIMANVSHVDDLARNVATVLEELNFDGIYFDFFSFLDEKNGFMNLIKSLKKMFLPKGLTLAYVGNNGEEEIDLGYDIPDLGKNLDMLILETYNFHDAKNEPKLADHHAPLYNRPWDTENKTVDSLVSLWISKGFPANKILLTIPLWGNSWKLSTNQTSPPAPANGKGEPGRQTHVNGLMGYFEICHYIDKRNWQVFQYDNETMGPYAVTPTVQKGTWVGYDDPDMAVIKSEYVLTNGLGGAAVKDVSYDDIRNRCNLGRYPMLTAIRKTLTPGWTYSSTPKLKKTSTLTSNLSTSNLINSLSNVTLMNNQTSTASSTYSFPFLLVLLITSCTIV